MASFAPHEVRESWLISIAWGSKKMFQGMSLGIGSMHQMSDPLRDHPWTHGTLGGLLRTPPCPHRAFGGLNSIPVANIFN